MRERSLILETLVRAEFYIRKGEVGQRSEGSWEVDLAVRLLARGAAVGNAEARLAPSRNGSLRLTLQYAIKG